MTREDHDFFTKFMDKTENKAGTLSGKLLLLEEKDLDSHHIFFDDNIQKNESYIVDAWDLSSKKRMDFEETKNIYLVRVNLIHAICDRQYFIKKLRHCIENRAKLVKMIPDEVYTTFEN